MANDREWERRTNDWVTAQHRSNRRKIEADHLDVHGEERRRFMWESQRDGSAKDTLSADSSRGHSVGRNG